jgi:RNA polymerase sigma factor (sigma-70 family)
LLTIPRATTRVISRSRKYSRIRFTIGTRFESLLLPLMNDAYNLARWLLKNQEDAEDLVQESYLRAFRLFVSFHEGSNSRAWFLRIVRNTCYTALGARDMKQKQVPLDWEVD